MQGRIRSRRIEIFDAGYPVRLRELAGPPDALWVRGALVDGPSVAIVGTRAPSREGEAYARELAATLARRGVTVWSGGALGIDRAAHEGALVAGGRTVLVAGGGLDARYPADVGGLYARVARAGALVGIVPDGAPPQRWVFLARNGVLAAMTDATVIVECPLRSGARSTGAAARRLGRPLWVAAQPPWSPFAAAVSEEARLGARVFGATSELLAALSEAGPGAPREGAGGPSEVRRGGARSNDGSADGGASAAGVVGRPSPEREVTVEGATGERSTGLGLRAALLRALAAGPRHPDELCEEVGEGLGRVMAALGLLVVEGVVERGPAGAFGPTSGRER